MCLKVCQKPVRAVVWIDADLTLHIANSILCYPVFRKFGGFMKKLAHSCAAVCAAGVLAVLLFSGCEITVVEQVPVETEYSIPDLW